MMAHDDLEKGEQANLKTAVADHERAALDSSIVRVFQDLVARYDR
jgi:hypothetical protein